MRFAVPLVLLAGPVLAAEAPEEDAVKKDLERMRGTWVLVSLEENGKTATEARAKEFKVTIDGERYVFTVGSEVAKGYCKLDPTKKPRAMDIIHEEGPLKGKTKLAVYDFDGDLFKVAVAKPGQDRPEGFAPAAGVLVEVWKREKP
jgi:uncharacterized protein (TIGR03067 family)